MLCLYIDDWRSTDNFGFCFHSIGHKVLPNSCLTYRYKDIYAYYNNFLLFRSFKGAISNLTIPNLNIAIGVNVNLDLLVDSENLFNTLNLTYNVAVNSNKISSMEEFVDSFSFFFSKSTAGESIV